MRVKEGRLSQFLDNPNATPTQRALGEQVHGYHWSTNLTLVEEKDAQALIAALPFIEPYEETILSQITSAPDNWKEAGIVASWDVHASNEGVLDMVKNLYNAASGIRREHRLNPADGRRYIEDMASWLVVHASGPQLNRRGIPPLSA